MKREEIIDTSAEEKMRMEAALELDRLQKCYVYASSDDKKVIWAVLNKYVPFLCAEGIL